MRIKYGISIAFILDRSGSMSEYERLRETKLEDLITLCFNCQYLAHYLLRTKRGNHYKDLENLLPKLNELSRT